MSDRATAIVSASIINIGVFVFGLLIGKLAPDNFFSTAFYVFVDTFLVVCLGYSLVRFFTAIYQLYDVAFPSIYDHNLRKFRRQWRAEKPTASS